MKKQGAGSGKLVDKPRKSPRLNKVTKGKSHSPSASSSRRGGVKDVQPSRAIRSMKFSETKKDTNSFTTTGRRAGLRNLNTRKAAERASEDIAMELILEDETDEDSRNCAFDSKSEEELKLGGNVNTDNLEEDMSDKGSKESTGQKKGKKPKRKRGHKQSNSNKSEVNDTNGQEGGDSMEFNRNTDVPDKSGDESPHDTEEDSDDDRSNASSYTPPPTKKPKLKTGILEKLQDSSGFVDRVEISLRPEDLVPMRRTPRMASLNALAKVNAVLDSYSPATVKPVNDMKKPNKEKKLHSLSNQRGERRERKSLSSYSVLDKRHDSYLSCKTGRRRCSSLSTHMDYSSLHKTEPGQAYWDGMFGNENMRYYDDNSFFDDGSDIPSNVKYTSMAEKPISDNHVSSTSSWYIHETPGVTKKDKAVQTVVNHKAVQTDSYLLQGFKGGGDMRQRTCRCGKSKNSNFVDGDSGTLPYGRKVFTRIPPRITSPAVDVPLRSSIFTKTDLHAIAIPITKRHILSHTDMKDLDGIGSEHLDLNRSKRMASLNAMAMMNAMVILDQPYSSFMQNNFMYQHKQRVPLVEKQAGAPLKIPKINYAATSTSNFSSSNKAKGHIPMNYKALHLKNLPSTVEKLVGSKRAVPSSPKMVNGWMFDGEPIEKPYEYDDRMVLRRYYTSMRRNNEVINVRDSVLLKSGTKKKDIPFVARVAAIWEEDDGDSISDMTISVFWYYRPEQTEIGRLANFHGEMEVLASRHRDDNSVACIVDKCYVLSYPQYCRFRARSKLHRESRRTPLSPVPPSESTRPGSMPPPNTDPRLVFFCRQVYDFRTGRVLKNPFY